MADNEQPTAQDLARVEWRRAHKGEAEVPDMMTPAERQRRTFENNNNYRRPEDLFDVFNYDNAFGSFTEEEEQVFAEAFKFTPKDFDNIAKFLPGRTAADCMHYYNATKPSGLLKDDSLRTRDARRVGPRKEDMYFYADNTPKVSSKTKRNMDSKPINQHIKQLQKELGGKGPNSSTPSHRAISVLSLYLDQTSLSYDSLPGTIKYPRRQTSHLPSLERCPSAGEEVGHSLPRQ